MAMATTTAKTKKDVDEMSAADRLYDSLSYSYGKKGENISKNYNQSISQVDRGLLKRGMQRSSYGAQAIANMYKQRNDALNDNDSEMIATYEKMKGDIEAREQEQANWQAQFDASREDAAWNKEYQTNQFNWQKEQADRNYNYQVGRDAVADNQWNMTFQANQDAQKWQQGMTEKQFAADQAAQAWQQGMTEKQFAASQAETAWNQAFQTQQFEANQAAQAWEQAYKDRAFDAEQAAQAWQQDFSERQWQAQVEQWEKNYNYQAMSDERKYNFELVMSAIENGKSISDEALAKAGISREDFNNMKTEAAITGSGGYNPAAVNPPTNNTGEERAVNDSNFNIDLYGLGSSVDAYNTQKIKNSVKSTSTNTSNTGTAKQVYSENELKKRLQSIK